MKFFFSRGGSGGIWSSIKNRILKNELRIWKIMNLTSLVVSMPYIAFNARQWQHSVLVTDNSSFSDNSSFQMHAVKKVRKLPSSPGYCRKGLLKLYISVYKMLADLSHKTIYPVYPTKQYARSKFCQKIFPTNFGWLCWAELLHQLNQTYF